MEAHKERREEEEKEEEVNKKGSGGKIISNEDSDKSESVAKRVIRECIVAGSDNGRAQDPSDVLAFSRSVHNVDSSME